MANDKKIIDYADVFQENMGRILEKDIISAIPPIEAAIKKMAGNLKESLGSVNLDGLNLDGLKKVNDDLKKTNDLVLLNAKAKKAEAEANTQLEKQRKEKANADKAEIELLKKKEGQIKKEKDAYAKLSGELTKTKREAKNLGAELIALERSGKKNTEEYKKLAKEFDAIQKRAAVLDNKIKELDATVGDHQRNVGNYREALKDTARELGIFGGKFDTVIGVMRQWTSVLQASKAATEENALAASVAEAATTRWGKAARFTGTALKGLGIGALITLLASFAAAAKTTESGIVRFEALTNSLGSVIKVFVGRLGQFGIGLVEFFAGVSKDLSNTLFNLKQDILKTFGADAEIKKSTDNTSKAVDKMSSAFTGLGAAIEKVIDLEFELAQLRRQNRKDNLIDLAIIRVYASEVEVLNQLADDQTLSFQKREDAATKALNTLQKSADAEVRIAQRTVKVLQRELKIREQQSEDTLEVKEKLSEALDKLDDAETKREVQRLQGEQRQRLIRIKQLQNQVQLIEQTFDKEKELRDKQIQDLERSFDERQKLIENGDKLSQEKFNKEVQRISEAAQQYIDANELINISDEEQLAARIKSLQLGDKAEDILLKALTNRKAEIKDAAEQARQLNKQIIEDLKKQQQAEQDIKNEKVRGVQIELDNELKNATDNLREQAVIFAKIKALRDKQLKDDATFEKQKVTDDKTKSAELQAKEILKIDEKLKNDLRENELKYLDDIKAIHKKQIEEVFNYLDQITSGIQRGLAIRADLQQQADQRDIDRQQRLIDVQAQLAASGKENVLAETQARLDKAEEKRIQDAKRAAKQQENLTIIKTFSDTLNAALQTNKSFLQAFAEASAASGVVEAAFAKLFSGFYEGTESLGTAGTVPFKNGKDDILVSAKQGERLIGYDDSQKLAGLTNKEVVNAAMAYKNNDFNEIYVPQFKAANVSSTQRIDNRQGIFITETLSRKFDELKNEIANKPVSNTRLDELGNWTEEIQNKGLRTIIHHRSKSKIRRIG